MLKISKEKFKTRSKMSKFSPAAGFSMETTLFNMFYCKKNAARRAAKIFRVKILYMAKSKIITLIDSTFDPIDNTIDLLDYRWDR